ncbi:MAG: P-type DNA transfer ATPase VirB11 [Cyanobacteria bacterium SZAS LIN-2]|nr:P-type DNA transfer ATPase VirB11 [Cyanobacteria bacterium SZAS LIN-2]
MPSKLGLERFFVTGAGAGSGVPILHAVPPASESALHQYLAGLRPILEDPALTELCINRPNEAFVETSRGWHRVPLPFASYDWCSQVARLIAASTQQRVSPESPLLSASLPTGERVQIVLPPATTSGAVAITIRKPSDRVLSLDALSSRGLFARCEIRGQGRSAVDQELDALYARGEIEAFLRAAVRARKNILVSGPTGSGKTTLTKGLLLEIPADERLITLEDAKELVLDRHPNSVRLYYSKDGQGQALVTPKQLLEACLRMRPDRILLAELRSEEAYYYLRNVNSGHPGSITSVHASSARLAFEQLTLLVKESAAGREMKREDIQSLLYQLIDVVVQCGVEKQRRFVKEIWYGGVDREPGARH